MNKSFLMATIALTALALTAPSASAATCVSTQPSYVTEACNYVLSGDAADDAGATVAFVEGQAVETVQFLVDTYGHLLP